MEEDFRFTTPSYAGDRLVFTDAAAFQAFWAQHTATQPAPLPQVDFATETVIAGIRGHTTGCDNITLERFVVRPDGKVLVTVRTGSPPGCLGPPFQTNPAHVVKIAVPRATVIFR